MHFWEVVARVYARFSRPRNRSLNWFIPAFVKSSVGSSPGTSGELGTARWPCCSKYFRKDARISFAVICPFYRTSFPAALPQRLHHAVRLESLPNQVAEQPLELAVVGDRLAAAQPLVQRRFQQRRVIDVAEHVVDRGLRGFPGDPGPLDLHAHADLAALADASLGPRDC